MANTSRASGLIAALAAMLASPAAAVPPSAVADVVVNAPGWVLVDVGANDFDIDGDPIAYSQVGSGTAAGGSVMDLGGGAFSFQTATACEADSFQYRACDRDGCSDVKAVVIRACGSDGVSSGGGQGPGGESTHVPVVGVYGSVNVGSNTKSVDLGRTFHAPVVFAQVADLSEPQPVSVEVSHLAGSSLGLRLAKPVAPGISSLAAQSRVDYLVIEAGRWRLANGSEVEVGVTSTRYTIANGNASPSPKLFSRPFPCRDAQSPCGTWPPTLLTHVQEKRGTGWVTNRVGGVGLEGFLVGLQLEEADWAAGVQHDALETIGYLAIERWADHWGAGVRYHADVVASGDLTSSSWPLTAHHPTAFFASAPRVLASFYTASGDTAVLRAYDGSATKLTFTAQEETSHDSETNAGNNWVSFLALSGASGELRGESLDLPPYAWDQEIVMFSDETSRDIFPMGVDPDGDGLRFGLRDTKGLQGTLGPGPGGAAHLVSHYSPPFKGFVGTTSFQYTAMSNPLGRDTPYGLESRPATVNIHVVPRVQATFDKSCSAATRKCTFSTPAASGVTYTWSFGDGTTGSGHVVSHTYPHGGVFVVTLTAEDGYGNRDTAYDLTDALAPFAVISFLPARDCFAALCFFDGSHSSADTIGFSWTFGDGRAGTGAAPWHVYTRGGSLAVGLTVTNDYALAASTSLPFTLPDAKPVAAFTVTCDDLRCTFDASGSTDDYGVVGYSWSFGDGGTATGQRVVHEYADDGSYTASLTVTDTLAQSGAGSRALDVFDLTLFLILLD